MNEEIFHNSCRLVMSEKFKGGPINKVDFLWAQLLELLLKVAQSCHHIIQSKEQVKWGRRMSK